MSMQPEGSVASEEPIIQQQPPAAVAVPTKKFFLKDTDTGFAKEIKISRVSADGNTVFFERT